jgi:hypothetical protein
VGDFFKVIEISPYQDVFRVKACLCFFRQRGAFLLEVRCVYMLITVRDPPSGDCSVTY